MKTDLKSILISLGLGAGALLISQLPLVGLIAPALLVCAGTFFGTYGFAASCVPLLIIPLIDNYGVGVLAMLLISGAAGYAAHKRQSAFDALIICCAGALAGIWAFFGGVYVQSGNNLLSYLYTEAAADYAGAVSSFFQQAGLSDAFAQTSAAQLREMVANTIPACGILYALAVGFSLLLIPATAGRAFKRDALRIPKFYMWMLPSSFMWGLIFLIVVAYVGAFAQWPGFAGVIYAVQSLFTVALGLQGLSVLMFFYKAYGNPAMLVIGIICAALFAFTPLTLAGVADSALSLRKRWLDVNGPLPEKQPPIIRR